MKITLKIHRKVRHIVENHDEGHTIQFVITRVGYIRDSLYRGNLCGIRQNPRGQIYFCYTVKLVIAVFHIIGIPL